MPQVIPLVVYWGAVALEVSATTAALLSLASSAVVAYATKPKTPGLGDQSGVDEGYLKNIVSSTQPIPVIYGTRKVGGSIVNIETTDQPDVDGNARENDRINIIIVWGEGEISAVDTLYLDDVDVTTFFHNASALYTSEAVANNHVGTSSQTADTDAIAGFTNWTSDHKLLGLAYSYVSIWRFTTQSPTLPVITADISGKLVYDPRDTTTKFSNNPALCIYDFLTDEIYGMSVPSSEIDDQSFIDAANHCDELVSIPTGTQARYTCDGVLDTDADPIDNLSALLTSCRGMIISTFGTYRLIIDKAETAAFTIDESLLIGPISISHDSTGSRLNRIRVQFFNPDAEWRRDTRAVDSTSYRTADGGVLLEKQIDLPFTANAYTAQQLAGMELRASRYKKIVDCVVGFEGLRLEVGDVVNLSYEIAGYVDKAFRVINVTLEADDTVRLGLQEYSDDVYNLDSLNVESPPSAPNLPSPTLVATPSGLTLTPAATVLDDGGVASSIVVTWSKAAVDTNVVGYRIEWKKSTDTNYGGVSLGGEDFEHVIAGLVPGLTYNVRIQAVNGGGVPSAWASDSATAAGDTTAPGAPTSVAAAAAALAISITWVNSVDADLAGVEVWVSSTSTHGTGASLGVVRGAEFSHYLAAGTTRYYWLRSIDRTGNASAWSPTDAGAGVSATALELLDGDTFYQQIRPLVQTTWRYGFEDFEYDAGDWTTANLATFARDSDSRSSGTKAMLVNDAGSSSTAQIYYTLSASELAPLQERRTRVGFWYKQPATNGSSLIRVGIWDITAGQWRGYVELTPSAAWQKGEVFVDKIPETSTAVQFYVYPDRNGTGKSVLIDDVDMMAISDLIDTSTISDWIDTAAISTAYIGDAQITTAKIKDLNVETVKIKDNAVTIPVGIFYSTAKVLTYNGTATSAWFEVATISFPAPSGASMTVLVQYSAGMESAGAGLGYDYRLLIDGTPVETVTGNTIVAASGRYVWFVGGYKDTAVGGTTVYSLEARRTGGAGSTVNCNYRSITVMGTHK